MNGTTTTRPAQSLTRDLKLMLTKEELAKLALYPDSVGIATIGIGVNIIDPANMELTLSVLGVCKEAK